MNETQRNSLLCPNCRRIISRDEPACPYCGLKSPGAGWRQTVLSGGITDEGLLIRTVISINIGMYILSMFLFPGNLGLPPREMDPLQAFSPSGQSLLLLGATGTLPIDELHYWWSLITANFLHGSLLHIAFNMLAFRQMGALVIQLFGIHRMVSIYILTGVGGFLVSYLAGVEFTIGASAALCGLVGAALYYGKSRGGTVGQAVYKHTTGWIIGLFLIGLMPRINNWGHAGGVLSGILLGWLFSYIEKRRESFMDRLIATACALATVFALGWSVVNAMAYRFLS